MAGMVAARSATSYRGAYKALREAGKPPKVAIIAIGRRVAVLANALLRDDTLFKDSNVVDPSSHPSKAG